MEKLSGVKREEKMRVSDEGLKRENEMEKGQCSSQEQPSLQRNAGGWKTMPYIIGNETCEKLASMSLIANITVFLRSKYNLDGLYLVNVVSIWFGTCNFAPLAGAFVSDSYFGKFWTLLLGSFSSFLGMGILTLAAGIKHLRPPPCNERTGDCTKAQPWQLGILFFALGLLAVGAGGIRPCNIAFGVDQFDVTTSQGRRELESFYDWYYLSFTIALFVAFTVVVYIQTNVSWVIGLAIPTGFLAISILVFLAGAHIYNYVKPQGSVYTDLVKVVVAAYRKRRFSVGSLGQYSLYDPISDDESETPMTRLPHTERYLCLDKAAVIIDASELNSQGKSRCGWKLCSVQQVEGLKRLLGIFPVWFSGITCFIVMDQQNTFGILQAMQLNRKITPKLEIPAGLMGVTSMLALSVWITFYEQLLIPVSRIMANKEVRISLRQKMRTGIVMSILCMLVAGVTEHKRREVALRYRSFVAPMSLAWLLPQFILSGLTEAFSAIAVMEFLNKKLPQSMRTVAGSIFFLSISSASYLSSVIVNIVHHATKKNDGSAWLGGHDLNRNKLDYYYYIIAALGVVNFIYFTAFASRDLPSGSSVGDEEAEEVQ
nr:TPA_asm: hypothetical protein HUJ06_009990 [Nelumbo nucifera]